MVFKKFIVAKVKLYPNRQKILQGIFYDISEIMCFSAGNSKVSEKIRTLL